MNKIIAREKDIAIKGEKETIKGKEIFIEKIQHVFISLTMQVVEYKKELVEGSDLSIYYSDDTNIGFTFYQEHNKSYKLFIKIKKF